MDEFALINQYFRRSRDAWKSVSAGIEKGIGDDCAILGVTNQQIVVSTDTMVEGRHFPENCSGEIVAGRVLGGAVSDLAAMGADPLGFTLSLSIPQVDLSWCREFADSLHAKACHWNIPLIGGDTVRGPLSISVTVLGQVPPGQALLRSGAKPDDDIWVSGWLGDAAGGLEITLSGQANLSGSQEILLSRYQTPSPRLELGRKLRGVATSAIDVSDGLLADWEHIAEASGVGAEIYAERIPIRKELMEICGGARALDYALGGGDDYELCFTAPRKFRELLSEIASEDVPLSRIGRVRSEKESSVIDPAGKCLEFRHSGFNHFG